MRISKPGRISTSSIKKAKAKQKAEGGSFAIDISTGSGPGAAAGSGSVAGAGPVSAVDALIGLQEVADATHHASKGLSYGLELLDQLEEIRRGLILGSIPVAKLEALAKKLRNRQSSGEPGLDAILDDIELRARVELAKLRYS